MQNNPTFPHNVSIKNVWIPKMQICIPQTFQSRKCISGSRKLADPENAYLDPKKLQIPKMRSLLRKTYKSKKCKSGYGKLVDPDTKNLYILIKKTCRIFIYLQVWPSFLLLHQLPLQVRNNTQFLNIKKQTTYHFINKPLLDYPF
jgi:hypothetical protein